MRPSTTRVPWSLDPKRWLALGVIAIAQLMIVLDASIVNIALPQAQKDLGISSTDRQWVVTAYTLAFGGLLLLGGRIADYTGRKRTFIIGLLGFAAASALGGLAQNGGMLFGARALQGAFGALMAPAALALITTTFTAPKERARAFGVFGAISGGGAAIGLILGGVLTEYASWRWCLLVNIPIALIAVGFAIPLGPREPCPGRPQVRHPGRRPRHGWSRAPRLRLHRGRQAGRQRPGPAHRHGRLDRPGDRHLPCPGRHPARRVRHLGAAHDKPLASPAGRARRQPWRLLPGVPAARCWTARDVPVPVVLLPAAARTTARSRPASRSCPSAPASSSRRASRPSCCPGSGRDRSCSSGSASRRSACCG